METKDFAELLDHPDRAGDWLAALGVQDHPAAHQALVRMASAGITLDLLADISGQLEEHLPGVSDPDRVLKNLAQFVAAARSPLSLGGLFERDRAALPTLLQILSSSQHLSELLIRDPETFDLLRMTNGQPVSRDELVKEICGEVDAAVNEVDVMNVLRRYQQRETLRITYGDIVRKQRLDVVTRQISYLAEAICEAAIHAARHRLEAKRGVPRRADGQRARFVVLGLGRLGGTELNYSSHLDLVFLSDNGGKTDGDRSLSNDDYFERLAQEVVKYLTAETELGVAYNVNLEYRPHGAEGRLVATLDDALHYYDTAGRTWQRQAFVKARPVAGDLDLGEGFLEKLEPWVYRRYLNRADISGIKALKRRIERRAKREGGDERDIKNGHGGILDIEFVIQFLQLLNGGDLKQIRTGNTLEAIAHLEQTGCLTMQERSILEENYQFLRKLEHRLQIMFDLQTHILPGTDTEMKRLAIRMDYGGGGNAALEAFRKDLTERTSLNRKILDHLLHSVFDEGEVDAEVDLVLDPNPLPETIHEVLGKHGFADVNAAYRNLMTLGDERIPFLSTRRCRHFLASIAPQLLQTIAATPDPDFTLKNLSEVSSSLGGKGVLWELFSFNPPTLQLYVQLCASSPYLSGILTSNPGMIDELMDSLVLDRLPSLAGCRQLLDDLCRGAEDTEPMLHNFKNSQHLRVGVRDILGKETIEATHRALSDIAEVCLDHIARSEYEKLIGKHGVPQAASGGPCEFVVLGLGKLGGREPNYHSDLDVAFLYDHDGSTQPPQRGRNSATSNHHFFEQLSQRIVKRVTQLGPYGRLYEVDPRLRPHGQTGSLVMSVEEFAKFFSAGKAQFWQRQALCKARPVVGSDEARSAVMSVVRQVITAVPWSDACAQEIRALRAKLEQGADELNLKRAPGGTIDIEFIVQMLQLKHAVSQPSVLQPGTLPAIAALLEAGYLSPPDADFLNRSYRFLRTVESRIRLMAAAARHSLPRDPHELNKLAYFLDYEETRPLLADCREFLTENRRQFQKFFAS